jgi:hypothetical protein
LHDQKEIVRRLRDDPVSHRSRHDQIIAPFEPHRPEIGFDRAFPAMHEDQFVPVRIAIIKRHRRRAPRHVQLYVMVAQERHRGALRVVEIGRRQPVQIETMRAQLALEPDPAGWRMGMV